MAWLKFNEQRPDSLGSAGEGCEVSGACGWDRRQCCCRAGLILARVDHASAAACVLARSGWGLGAQRGTPGDGRGYTKALSLAGGVAFGGVEGFYGGFPLGGGVA